FLVLHALLEAALGHVLVDLGAADLLAGAHHIHGRFLSALERAHHGVDHAVVDQRLQACGSFHVTSWGKGGGTQAGDRRRRAGVRERYTARPPTPWRSIHVRTDPTGPPRGRAGPMLTQRGR